MNSRSLCKSNCQHNEARERGAREGNPRGRTASKAGGRVLEEEQLRMARGAKSWGKNSFEGRRGGNVLREERRGGDLAGSSRGNGHNRSAKMGLLVKGRCKDGCGGTTCLIRFLRPFFPRPRPVCSLPASLFLAAPFFLFTSPGRGGFESRVGG